MSMDGLYAKNAGAFFCAFTLRLALTLVLNSEIYRLNGHGYIPKRNQYVAYTPPSFILRLLRFGSF